MTEWQPLTDVGEESRDNAFDWGRRSLTRLRWRLRIAALTAVGVWGVYYLLFLHRSLQEIVLNLLWGVLLSLGLIQIGFRVVLRVYDLAIADRQHLVNHSARLQQLYAHSQHLLASLRPRPQEEAFSLSEIELLSIVQRLVEIFDAKRGSLLLLDEAGQTRQFAQVGLSPDVRPGPRPAVLSFDDPPMANSNLGPWADYLMPGVKQLDSFIAVSIVAGERLWGYLALADGGPFTLHDRSLLHPLAANLGMILENALHVQEMQRELAEAATLTEVSRAISSKLTQEDLLPYLAENLVRILEGTSCLIVLRNPHTGELQPVATFSPNAMEE